MVRKIEEYIKENFSFLDNEAQNRLIDEAVNSLKREIDNLNSLLTTNNKEEILKTAHKLKGILLNAGIEASQFEESNFKDLSLDEIKKKLRKALKSLDPLKA